MWAVGPQHDVVIKYFVPYFILLAVITFTVDISNILYLENSCSKVVTAHAFSKSCIILHNSIADPPRDGESAKLLAKIVILNWDDELPSACPKLWVVLYVLAIVTKR